MGLPIEEYIANAEVQYGCGNYEAVIETCKKILNSDKDNPIALSYMANAYFVMEKFIESRKVFRHIIKSYPTPENYFMLGNCYFELEEYLDAIKNYNKTIENGCEEPSILYEIYYLMGIIHMEVEGEYQKALDCFEKAENIKGDTLHTHLSDIVLYRTQIYKNMNRIEDAVESAKEYILLEPGNYEGYKLLSLLYLSVGNFEEAKNAIEEAIETFENDEKTYAIANIEYCKLLCIESENTTEENAEKKQELLNRAKEYLSNVRNKKDILGEHESLLYISEANIYIHEKNYEKSAEIARDVIKNDKCKDELYRDNAYAILLESSKELNDLKEVKECAAYLKKSSNGVYAQVAYYEEAYATKELAKTDSAYSSEWEGLYKHALAYYRNYQIQNPMDYGMIVYRAKAYADIGNFERAREVAEALPEGAQSSLDEYIRKMGG